MPLVSDKAVERALEVLADKEDEGAAARAAHEFEDARKKVVFAELVRSAPDDLKTQGAREAWALASPTYLAHLDHIRIVAEADYAHRNKRAAAAAHLDAWRTENSNARAAGRIG